MGELSEYGPTMVAVTLALKQLISAADASLAVTVQMPSAAQVSAAGASVNLYLYRDELLELRVTEGNGHVETRSLGEKLNYLVTAFGPDESALLAHGLARTAIANSPVLTVTLPSGAMREVELHFTTLTLTDLTSLWIAADATYRLSFTFAAILQPADSPPQQVWSALTDAVAQAGTGSIIAVTGADASASADAATSALTAAGLSVIRVALADLDSPFQDQSEKNLAAVLDRAENDGAVLLLDEADALFDKRTEVGDAHDRYANLDTGALLERLKKHQGAVIATTSSDHRLSREYGAVEVSFPPDS